MPATRPLESFDVSVLSAHDEGTLWVSAVCRQGTIHAVPRPMPNWAELIQVQPRDWLTDNVRRARPARDEANKIGAALNDIIFGLPEIRALFEQTRGAAARNNAQVLLRLMTAPDHIGAWPWELLIDPSATGKELSLARDVHVVRSARTRTYPVQTSAIEPPLNLLMVLSSPLRKSAKESEAPFDLYEEKRSLLSELTPLVERGLLKVVVEDRPSIDRLRQRMNAERRGFHIVHFLGHAQPNGVQLEDRFGFGQLVLSSKFSELLQQLPELRLAVFAGCETAVPPTSTLQTAWPGQLSTTDYTVRDASPAVIGMQAVLPFSTERTFTKTFYQGVTAGQSISEALRIARWAIFDDDTALPDLVDWAVPALFVGGDVPGPLIDPSAKATRPEPTKRAIRRIELRQGDRRFFARLNELRTSVDALSGRLSARVLVVAGQSGVGKSRLLDRALDDLDPNIAQLYVTAARLADDDGLEELCRLVVEVLKAAGARPPAKGRRSPMQWWEGILEVLTASPFALVVDDIDELSHESPVIEALTLLMQRRGSARLAVSVTGTRWSALASMSTIPSQTVSLAPLSWHDTWQWIRRNLPSLGSRGEDATRPYFSDLGPQLEHWERLAVRLAQNGFDAPSDIEGVVAELAGTGSSSDGHEVPVFGGQAAAAHPTAGPLQVAVAGPHLSGRTTEFARSVTELAAKHVVAGRAVGLGTTDASSSVAELLSIDSPLASGQANTAELLDWFAQVEQVQPDILVLDYGADRPSEAQRQFIDSSIANGLLVIAAGGNEGKPVYPAWWPGVLAVGSHIDGKPTSYSPYFPDAQKPDVYAPNTLDNSVLSRAVAKVGEQGTSYSAIYAAAAAVLVWATYRDLPADQVHRILTGRTVDEAESATKGAADLGQIAVLNIEQALRRTREILLLDTLEAGRMSVGDLLSSTGLPSDVAIPILDGLTATGRLVQLHEGAQLVFENPKALYQLYKEARAEMPSSAERTRTLDALVRQADGLVSRRKFESFEVKRMMEEGDDGQRIIALAAMHQRPEVRDPELVVDVIGKSRSAFEQYQAIRVAEDMVDELPADVAGSLSAVLEEQTSASGYISEQDPSRWVKAEGIKARLAQKPDHGSVPTELDPEVDE